MNKNKNEAKSRKRQPPSDMPSETGQRDGVDEASKVRQVIPEPEGGIGTLRLADVIDRDALQSMMEEFHRITRIGVGVLDVHGRVLVGVGWQDICTKFHRVHPDTLKNCLESDVFLSRGVPAGTFKAYRCKNSLWDIMTPIEVGGRHLGNICLGQFFYEDEVPDVELFRRQARQYGFDETEYLAALDRVPRWSRETVYAAMAFYTKLAAMISSLSYSAIKLSRAFSQKEVALRQLQESEERHRAILHATMDGFWVADMQGRLLEVNEAYCQMSGYGVQELLAMRISDLEVAETKDEFAAHIQKIVALGKDRFESWHRRKDGGVFDVEISVRHRPSDGGQLIAFVRDITERKRIEEVQAFLAQTSAGVADESFFHAMARYLARSLQMDFVCIDRLEGDGLTARTVAVWCDGHFEDNVSYALKDTPCGDVVGKAVCCFPASVCQFFPRDPVLQDLRAESYVGVTLWSHAGKPIGLIAVIGRHPLTNRPQVEATLKLVAVRAAGELERLDAEEALKYSRDRLEEAQRTARIGNWEANLVTDQLYWSEVIFEIFGFDPNSFKPSVHAFYEAVHPDDLELVFESERRSERTGLHDVVHRIVRPNGEIRFIHELATRHSDDQGNLVMLRGTVQDITERKQVEAARAKLESQLQQAQKMESVGRLAGGVAHDFNNMLGVILGHAELALMRLDPAHPLHGNLEEIRKAADHSASLTRQLLAFARKQTIAPKVLDLNDVVGGMLKMLARLIGEDIALAWRPGAKLWPVRVDASQIDQILANLCVNARDAIDGVGAITIGTGKVKIDAACSADHPEVVPGEYVMLTVGDTGCGMDLETRANLFEPFFTTKETGKGTGLGLAMVYGAVKQNRGFIDVRSEPGQGSVFTIYLPRHGGKIEPSARREAASGPAERGHETILLVEDEPAILEMTKTILERLGYAVIAASNPGEAIRLAREHAGEIHLLMTDVVMPEMNGRDLAKHLMSLCPQLRRLFMSGYTAEVIAHRGILEKGVHFIQKPFSINDLSAKIREALAPGADA